MIISEKVAKLMLLDRLGYGVHPNHVNYISHRFEDNKFLIKFEYHQFDVIYREKYISEVSFDISTVFKYIRSSKLDEII